MTVDGLLNGLLVMSVSAVLGYCLGWLTAFIANKWNDWRRSQ